MRIGNGLGYLGDQLKESDAKELGPGGYASMPAREHHYGMTRSDSVLQLTGEGPWDIHYVNPNDDPRHRRASTNP